MGRRLQSHVVWFACHVIPERRFGDSNFDSPKWKVLKSLNVGLTRRLSVICMYAMYVCMYKGISLADGSVAKQLIPWTRNVTLYTQISGEQEEEASNTF